MIVMTTMITATYSGYQTLIYACPCCLQAAVVAAAMVSKLLELVCLGLQKTVWVWCAAGSATC